MRIVGIMISSGVGVYIMWQVANPLPVLLEPCLKNTVCVAANPVAAGIQLPALRVELYDPAIESRLGPGRREPRPVRIVSAEVPWILDGGAAAAPGPGSSRFSDFRMTRLGRPGAQGVCLVLDGGRPRCLALIDGHDE